MWRGHRVLHRAFDAESLLRSGATCDNRTDTDNWDCDQYAVAGAVLDSLSVEFRRRQERIQDGGDEPAWTRYESWFCWRGASGSRMFSESGISSNGVCRRGHCPVCLTAYLLVTVIVSCGFVIMHDHCCTERICMPTTGSVFETTTSSNEISMSSS